jgi:hypothetical protein
VPSASFPQDGHVLSRIRCPVLIIAELTLPFKLRCVLPGQLQSPHQRHSRRPPGRGESAALQYGDTHLHLRVQVPPRSGWRRDNGSIGSGGRKKILHFAQDDNWGLKPKKILQQPWCAARRQHSPRWRLPASFWHSCSGPGDLPPVPREKKPIASHILVLDVGKFQDKRY